MLKILVLVITLLNILPAPAQVSEPGRPPSAFSICCCKNEDQTNSETTFGCSHFEEACPEGYSQYPEQAFNCPSSLSIRKYKR